MSGRTYFCPIGISRYGGVRDLNAIPQLVTDLWTYVSQTFDHTELIGAEQVQDGFWDLQRVERVLDAGLWPLQPEDTLIVYWAGHGDVHGDHRLELSEGTISTSRLADWLLTCPAENVVCILDCCTAGEGLSDVAGLAERLKSAEALPEVERRAVTLIATARAEFAEEGAFVKAMLEVLYNGPGPQVGPEHRWDSSDSHVSCSQLVAAANLQLAGTQQAVVRSLRDRELGRFFPSAWFRRTQRQARRSIHPGSAARRKTSESLLHAGQSLPIQWTLDGLTATMEQLRTSNGLNDLARHRLAERIAALRLALSAEALVLSHIDPTKISSPALAAARRAAVEGLDATFDYQFDVIFDVASKRSGRHARSSVEAVVRFLARLDHEVNGEVSGRRAILTWGEEHGLDVHRINDFIDDACKPQEDLRLVIDLRGLTTHRAGDEEICIVGQLFDRSAPVGGPLKHKLTAVARGEVELAIVALLSQSRTLRHLDILAPDEFLLLDVESIKMNINKRLVGTVGQVVPASLHCDRTGDLMLEEFPRYFQALTQAPLPGTFIDEWHTEGYRVGEFSMMPEVTVFRVAAPSTEPPNALLDAIYASPIVIWPAIDLPDRDRFASSLAEHWPNLPAAARDVRLGTSDQGGADLEHVRFIWDEPEWIELFRVNYAHE